MATDELKVQSHSGCEGGAEVRYVVLATFRKEALRRRRNEEYEERNTAICHITFKNTLEKGHTGCSCIRLDE